MSYLRTEQEMLDDVKKFFGDKLEATNDILSQQNVSQINRLYFTTQKEYCLKYFKKFHRLSACLKNEKLRAKMYRYASAFTEIEQFDLASKYILEAKKNFYKAMEEKQAKLDSIKRGHETKRLNKKIRACLKK